MLLNMFLLSCSNKYVFIKKSLSMDIFLALFKKENKTNKREKCV